MFDAHLEPTPLFDFHHPPEAAKLDACVHCGFCLPACPTYVLGGEEMDSPRGRIQLMRLVSDGEIALNATTRTHFDRCLGCMGCVTACPSGVEYDALIEATRAQVARNAPRGLADRLFRQALFAIFPYPARLRLLALPLLLYQRSGVQRAVHVNGFLDRLPARLRALESLAPPLDQLPRRLPARIAARGPVRARVGLLTGCVQSVFFDEVNRATVRVLRAEGCEVIVPPDQGCCGALEVHTGEESGAIDRAKRLITAFEGANVDTIIVNAAGCGSTMKEYHRLLRDEPEWAERAPKVQDVTEFLASLEPRAPRHPLPVRVAYHDACHLSHAQRVRSAPRALLRRIPGLTLVEPSEADLCCGSAGVYNLLEPAIADTLGDRKATALAATWPDVIAGGNPGCTLQIARSLRRQSTPIPVLHTIQLIDASIRNDRVPGSV